MPLHSGNDSRGSAIIAVLCVIALLSLLLVSLIQSIRTDKAACIAVHGTEQARLSAQSAVAAASSLLGMTATLFPAYIVAPAEDSLPEGNELLLLGASNLVSTRQIVPLCSCELKNLAPFPSIATNVLPDILQQLTSTNPGVTIDLNDPSLTENSPPGTDEAFHGGLAGPKGRYPALWQPVKDSEGNRIGRYAFILLDESARVNPLLHEGAPRNDPRDWDGGAAELSLTNEGTPIVDHQTAMKLQEIATLLPTQESLGTAFDDQSEFTQKKHLLTRNPCPVPDLIPYGLKEGGQPKYNLNDLATNPAWGATSYDRASNIARIIDLNLPKFKTRDLSLSGKGGDPELYTRRLACSIVDYISPTPGPTGPRNGEPSGRELTPYVTQIAERCTLLSRTPSNAVIESRFFVELWNPYTSKIPAGSVAELLITNRARVDFGNALKRPFREYRETSDPLPEIAPNEFIVVGFAPEQQSWESPEPTTNPPFWSVENEDGTTHQAFSLSWNGKLVDYSRRPPISPGSVTGGLCHYGQKLGDTSPRWQTMTVPTWPGSGAEEQEASDEAIQTGNYRFVGDPRATFLTAYSWSAATNYTTSTLWKGINPASRMGRGYLLDPKATWTRRDRVPVNPVSGNLPSSPAQTPDEITSSYDPLRPEPGAPFVIRKGAMKSLGELGHIFDPAQVDDQGKAPPGGSAQSRFCSGGGRTLRIGQPEFHVNDPSADWDTSGKRAVELVDLFTLRDSGRNPPGAKSVPGAGIPGRINVNTASHAVLEILFSGVGVTSDRRFTNCSIGPAAADRLATLLEEHRPYSRLSDLRILTQELVNADTYTPPLSRNVPGVSPPVADVFDRAREEAFAKIIGHCTVQTRTFRMIAVGEALNKAGKTTGRAVLEGILQLRPDASGHPVPSLLDVRWH